MPLFQNESKCKNEFDLHENEPLGRTHFHMNGLKTCFDTEATRNGLFTERFIFSYGFLRFALRVR